MAVQGSHNKNSNAYSTCHLNACKKINTKKQGAYLCTHKMENYTWYTMVMQKTLCIAFTVYDVNPEMNKKQASDMI
jgi:hypothetical protein